MSRHANSPSERPELLSLLRGARDNPEDDSPRLVLADWLEEHGNASDRARAEFVRLQCAQARLSPWDPGQRDLAARETALPRQHEADWLGSKRSALSGWTFRRGLVSVSANAKTLTGRKWLWFRRSEAGAWCAELIVNGELEGGAGEGLGPLLESGRLDGFHSLRWAAGGLNAEAASLLAAWPGLGRLTDLDLGDNDLGPEGLAALLASPHLGNLRGLGLWSNGLGVRGMEVLGNWPGLARLERLNVAYNALFSEGLQVLARSPHSPSTRVLEVWSNDIGPDGVRTLFESSLTDRLCEVDLAYSQLHDEGVVRLASYPRLANLQSLQFLCNAIGPGGARALADCPYLRGLKRLTLDSNSLGPEGARALLDSPHLGGLVELTAGGNGIDDATLQAMKSRFGKLDMRSPPRVDLEQR